MTDRVELRRHGAEKGIHVTEESADYWRSLGYVDPQTEKKPAAKRAPAKKSDDK